MREELGGWEVLKIESTCDLLSAAIIADFLCGGDLTV